MPNRRNTLTHLVRNFFGIRTAEEAASSTLQLDPQIARRMTQLESELARLAESQQAARDERARLVETIEILQAARGEKSPIPETTRSAGGVRGSTSNATPAQAARRDTDGVDETSVAISEPPPVFDHAE